MQISTSICDSTTSTFFNDIIDEIYSQLYYLQLHCVKFLFNLIKEKSINVVYLIDILQSFVAKCHDTYKKETIDNTYLFQCCGQILRLIRTYLNVSDNERLNRITMIGLTLPRIKLLLPQGSMENSETLHSLFGATGTRKITFSDLKEAFIVAPYLTSILMHLVGTDPPSDEENRWCLARSMEAYDSTPSACQTLLQVIGKCPSLSPKSLISFTAHQDCLLGHLLLENCLPRSSEHRCQLSLGLRDAIAADVVSSSRHHPPDCIIDLHERLFFCLLADGLPGSSTDGWRSRLGWLIVVTHSRPASDMLLSVVKALVEAREMGSLAVMLAAPSLAEARQLLLVCLWHPALGDEVAMQDVLDLCYTYKPSETPIGLIEQLCISIKTRWDTLKRFNERLSSINKEHDMPTQDILTLTTIGNTSHLELVTGLPDPTGLDMKVVLELLDRTGTGMAGSFGRNLSATFIPENIEEYCDKSIFFCSVSIRRLWECLVLTSSIETRQTVFQYLHQNNLMMDLDVVKPELSFYTRLQTALYNNNLDLCHKLYRDAIVSRIGFLTHQIEHINPLSLRLELLENIYAMLFTTEYDMFNGLLASNHPKRSEWPFPETVARNELEVEKEGDEVSPYLDKNRFICSFFLFKDVLKIVQKNLMILMSSIHGKMDSESSQSNNLDREMATLINYPFAEELETRINSLEKSISAILWRVDLLIIGSNDHDQSGPGIFDIPLCVIYDGSSRTVLDTQRTIPNLKIRPQSNSNTRKEPKKANKVGDDREVPQPETPSRITQLGVIHHRRTLTQSFSIHNGKDKFILFQFMSAGNLQDSLNFFSIDEGDTGFIKYTKNTKCTKISKGNCLFLMDCVSTLIEPIEIMTKVIMYSGYRTKAEEIYEKFGNVKNDNLRLSELLSEIKYQEHFDSFTSQLSAITRPSYNHEVSLSISSTDNQQFGKFNWSKLSQLNSKLSSKHDNEYENILNQLLTLNSRCRPVCITPATVSKEVINCENKHFNCGLLFDIAIFGSTSKWQLSQMVRLIESQYALPESHNTETSSKRVEKYHKMDGLISTIKSLLEVFTDVNGSECNSYMDLEMNSMLNTNYSRYMDEWQNQLKSFLELLKSNQSADTEDPPLDVESKHRWRTFKDLITFINETCTTNADGNFLFKYLDRQTSKYLDSLSSHLEIFAKFLSKYKNFSGKPKFQTQISNIDIEDEFSVLRRSPLNSLGELIFIQSEDPLSEEILQISGELGLNISSIVLENCIPTISSFEDSISLEEGLVSISDRPKVYNPSYEPPSESAYHLNPLNVVIEILNRIKKILSTNIHTFQQSFSNSENDNSNQAKQHPLSSRIASFSGMSVDTSSTESSTKTKESGKVELSPSRNTTIDCNCRALISLSQNSDWQDILTFDIAAFENVDLDLLKTSNEKVAFFINLYNLMMIHMSVLAAESGKTNMKYRSFESKLMRSNFCYKVGQIGALSIDQISQYYLNIPDVTFGDLDHNSSEFGSSLPTPIEQMYRSSCITCQIMAIFGMIDGTVSSQPLRIYNADSIHKDLQNNLSYAIKYKTTYESDKRQVNLPQIFKWYSKLVCTDNSDQRYRKVLDSSNTAINANLDECLIENILSKCNEKVCQKYSLLFRLDTETIIHNPKDQNTSKMIKVIWQSRSEAISINYIIKHQDVNNNIPKVRDALPSAYGSFNSVASITSTPYFPLPNYQPTIEALSHIRDRSPLLACLSYLIIGDDFVSQIKMNLDTEMTPDLPMEEKLSEIRSYKYSRIFKEYPAISNWILVFWSQWLLPKKSVQQPTLGGSSDVDSLVTYCCSNIPIEIRWAAFTHPMTKDLDQILIDYSLNVMSRDQQGYLHICSALLMLQSQTIAYSYKLQRLLDIILVKSARFWANGLIINGNNRKHLPPDIGQVDNNSLKLQEERLLDCVYAIKDDKLRLMESARYAELFDIENALTLMEYNYNSLQSDDITTKEEMMKEISLFRIFKRIRDLVLICQRKYELWMKPYIPTEFLDRYRLRTLSESDPDLVLKFLIGQKQFDLAKCWARVYMPECVQQKIEAEYLVSLVRDEGDNRNVVQLLSHISKLHQEGTVDDFMRVVHCVMEHSDAPFAIIMVCAYTIKNNIFNEFKSIDDDPVSIWREKVLRAWVGASMVRSISNEVTREQYSQLVQHPHLIMEQLIMNAEIDTFRKMMELYKEQKKSYRAILKDQNLCETSIDEFITELNSERINTLLTNYICKALELFAVREFDEVDTDEEFFSPRSMNKRPSFASMSSRFDILSSSESVGTVVDSKCSITASPFVDTACLPPHQWYKDSDAPKCMCCRKEKFSMFNRRHHCRKCGRVICSQCSTHRTLIDGVTVRICDDCCRLIQDQQDLVDRARRGSVFIENQKVCSVSDQLYSRHNVLPRTESVSSSLPIFDSLDEPSPNVMKLGIGALENGWRLGTDPVENDTIRQMFCYDDAPSVTIAFSLADFHSNSNLCGNVLLNRVEYLADFLKPMKNNLSNPEVDYLLVLDIAKQIAYKAKLKFSRLNNDLDFYRAENYLSRLDLLNVLVKSNYGNYLPSLRDGSKFIERIQSLRDKLIREERLELAGIVSSKAGLSNDPVFVAMGLHALEEGKYEEARRLFGSCSKVGKYGSHSSSKLPYPVNEIMKILEGNKLSLESAEEIISNVMDSDNLLKTPDLKFKERMMTTKQIEEAVYYLDIYNAPLQCLQFMSRKHLWSKAIDYVLKKNVSSEVFIDGLILPAINMGHFASIKSEIIMKEGGFNIWKSYYEALCKCLDRKGCYDDLLEYQSKMGDNFSAAKTLINYFYLRNSHSYGSLKSKICFLENAQKHLEAFITQKEKVPNFDLEKFKKNLILIKQQIKVTLFLTDSVTISRHQAKLGYLIVSNPLPTLFGDPEAIKHLCLTILFCRPNLSDGLQMLCPLMSQCHIYPEVILTKAVEWLLDHPHLVSPMASESDMAGMTAVLDLANNIGTCYRLDLRKNDEVLLSMLSVLPSSVLSMSNFVNKFIALFKSEAKKIDAYITVKDFKRAFAIAVRLGYINDVQRILDAASGSNDLSGAIPLCMQWLSQNGADTNSRKQKPSE